MTRLFELALGPSAFLAIAACADEPAPPWDRPGAPAEARLVIPTSEPKAALPDETSAPSAESTANPLESASSLGEARGHPSPDEEPEADRAGPPCHEGLVPSGEPRRDVVRLGLSCGASVGFTRERDEIEGVVAAEGTSVSLALPVVAGHCYRVIAAAEPTVLDLTLELRSPRDVVLAKDEGVGAIAMLYPHGAVCSSASEELTLIVGARDGRGRFSVEVWTRPEGRGRAPHAR